jgi:hypothetical protein
MSTTLLFPLPSFPSYKYKVLYLRLLYRRHTYAAFILSWTTDVPQTTEHTFSCPYMCCTYIMIMCFRPSDFLATLARDDGFLVLLSTDASKT